MLKKRRRQPEDIPKKRAEACARSLTSRGAIERAAPHSLCLYLETICCTGLFRAPVREVATLNWGGPGPAECQLGLVLPLQAGPVCGSASWHIGWPHWDLTPGLSACEARPPRAAAHRVSGLLARLGWGPVRPENSRPKKQAKTPRDCNSRDFLH